jgi:hypothetical protein
MFSIEDDMQYVSLQIVTIGLAMVAGALIETEDIAPEDGTELIVFIMDLAASFMRDNPIFTHEVQAGLPDYAAQALKEKYPIKK